MQNPAKQGRQRSAFASLLSIHSEKVQIGILLALCGVLYFAGLSVRHIWDIDEGMHAAIAQTMVISGDWVTPTFNNAAFLDKPILFNWLNAIAFSLFGFSEFAARLPAAIAGLACVIFTYLFGRRIFDARTGLLAGVILATSLEMMVLSRVVQYDIPFTLFTTAALYLFASAVIVERHRKHYFLAFYVAVALAFLTKGPLAIVITGLAIGGYLLFAGRLALLREMHLPLGTIIFLIIVAPWMFLMEQANPGYLDYFLVRQHLANFIDGAGEYTPRHAEPFYYYLPVLLAGFLPWSLMLPQAIARGFRERRADGMTLFLIIWLVAVFAFFSAATSKLSTYLMPIFPAAALLLGHYWSKYLDQPDARARRGILIGTGSMFVILALFTVYAVVEKPWTYWDYRSGIVWNDFEIAISLLTALFGLAFLLTWLRRNLSAFVALSAISPIFLFYVLFAMVPGVNAYKGTRQLALELDTRLPPGENFRFYGRLLDSAMFYAGRDGVRLKTTEDLQAYLASDERMYVLVRTRARKKEDAFQGDYYVLKVIGNKAIVSNQPDS
jgi:4-amino-4-deoxy-L-arabinose transferase-like glycosyltransferase